MRKGTDPPTGTLFQRPDCRFRIENPKDTIMQNMVILSGLVLLTVAPLAAQTPPTGPHVHGDEARVLGLDVATLEQIDRLLQEQTESQEVAGVVALIGRGEGLGYFEAFGLRDLEAGDPMDRDALFRIYSMTKPIVAVAAMSLWQEDRFDLDEPIADRLPEWRAVTVEADGGPVPAEQPITPRHLMTHSSGLNYSPVRGMSQPGLTVADFSERIAQRPLRFQPGTSYQYGYSIDVLGRYLEAVADQPLDVILSERIFEPLGMEETGFWVEDPADTERIAQMIRRPEPGRLVPGRRPDDLLEEPTLLMGGQGLVSNAADYARFCRMLVRGGELDGVRVLETETVDLMFTEQLEPIGRSYGLGGAVDGRGRYSWGGAAGTRFFVDRRNDLFTVFMIQAQRYQPPTYGLFQPLVEQAIAPAPTEPIGAPSN